MRAIGLENSGAWAVFAGLMPVIPYFGPLLITAATGLAASTQFESDRRVRQPAVLGMVVGLAARRAGGITKVVAERVEGMEVLAELLGEYPFYAACTMFRHRAQSRNEEFC